jgi:hypothetical protein
VIIKQTVEKFAMNFDLDKYLGSSYSNYRLLNSSTEQMKIRFVEWVSQVCKRCHKVLITTEYGS